METMEGLGIQNNEKRGRLMLGLNNTPSRGYSHDSNAIYLEEIHSELTEFYTSQLFLILTDHGNVVSKCQVQVIVGLRPPTGSEKYRKMLIMLVEVLQFCMFRFRGIM